MGACKVCGEIYGVLDIKDGICVNCRNGRPREVKKIEASKVQKVEKISNKLGMALIIFGILIGVFGFMYDASVEAGTGIRVNNIGLMNLKSNMIMVGGFLLLIGTLVTLFRPKDIAVARSSEIGSSSTSELIKLSEMLEKGLITEEEFRTQKVKLLA